MLGSNIADDLQSARGRLDQFRDFGNPVRVVKLREEQGVEPRGVICSVDAREDVVRMIEATPPTELPPEPALSAEFERIRWFPMPREALAELRAAPDLSR